MVQARKIHGESNWPQDPAHNRVYIPLGLEDIVASAELYKECSFNDAWAEPLALIYVVIVGRTRGFFSERSKALVSTRRFPGSLAKAFDTLEEGIEWPVACRQREVLRSWEAWSLCLNAVLFRTRISTLICDLFSPTEVLESSSDWACVNTQDQHQGPYLWVVPTKSGCIKRWYGDDEVMEKVSSRDQAELKHYAVPKPSHRRGFKAIT